MSVEEYKDVIGLDIITASRSYSY